MAAIRRTTGCSCIPTVTGRSIANRLTWHHRVPHGAFERLERHAGKLARVVLRGLDGSNPVRLPGAWRITLPLLRPALTMAFIIRGVDAFRIFALPLALVGRHLPVLSTFAYVEYLEYGNPHTSAASSTLLLVMILITVGVYLRLAGPEEVVR